MKSVPLPTKVAIAVTSATLLMVILLPGLGVGAPPAPAAPATTKPWPVGVPPLLAPIPEPAASAPAAPAPAPAPATPKEATAVQPPGNPPPTNEPTVQAPAGRPAPRPVPPDPGVLTDQRIGASIKKGSDWLYRQFDSQTHVLSPAGQAAATSTITIPGQPVPSRSLITGVNALSVYALMQCGLAMPDDPRFNLKKSPEMRGMIDALRAADIPEAAPPSPPTYAHAIRATALALAVANRDESQKGAAAAAGDLKALQDDVVWLLRACRGGAYTYVMPPGAPADAKAVQNFYANIRPNQLPRDEMPWDNSNSQYGLLGVWSAAEAEVEIPASYWAMVDNHWVASQRNNGTWDYGPPIVQNDTLAMTCAGLASLLVAHEYLDPPLMGSRVGRDPFGPSVTRGLAWLEEGENPLKVGQAGEGFWGYNLYGVERVGLASGFKHLGKHDWYATLANTIVRTQQPDGQWLGGAINTSYALLFLARGRHPIVMGKLRFDGDKTTPAYWANRPRDAANLARFAGKAVERSLNWQVLHTSTHWREWTDTPVLELASHVAPKLSAQDLENIRQYVYAGGMLYTQADGDSAAFDAFARKLAKDLFNQELVNVPPDHAIFSGDTLYAIKPAPQLKMVTNGARILMLHSPRDITRWWQQRDDKRHKADFQLGINMFVYNAGKRDLRNRIDPAWVEAVSADPVHNVKVARLEYGGNWNPEPSAWTRYANWFQRQTSYKLDVATVKLNDLKPGDAPLAVLTGTAKQGWSAEAVSAVKSFVDGGGVLLVDSTGGGNAFSASADELLRAAFPGARAEPVADKHPLLSAGAAGMEDLTKRRLREVAVRRLGRTGGALQMLKSGKGYVLSSPLDVTSGLLGTDTAGILGYEPAYAQALVKNLIFWTLDQQAGG